MSRPAPAATPRAATGCAHCGLGVPSSRRRDEGPEFCCGGCEQVYGLIQEWGYGKFYRFAGQHGAPLEPARVSGRDFGELDDPRLLAELTDPMAQGRCRTRLYLEGVHCAACVWLVEKLPEAVPGVDSVRLNLGSAVAEVVWDPARVALSRIGQALDRLGYAPHLHRAGRLQEARRREDRSALVKLGVAVACAMNLMFLHGALYAGEYSGMASPFETYFRWVSLGVSLPVVLFSARPFFQAAAGRTALARRAHGPPGRPGARRGLRRLRLEHGARERAHLVRLARPCWWRRCSARGRCSAAPSGRPSSAPTACAGWPSWSSPAA